MTTPISTLISGIKSKCGLFLGSTFSENAYGIDIGQNRSKGATKGYAVLPENCSQEESIGALVVNQVFNVTLTDTYNPGKTNDKGVQDTTNSLYDLVYGLYENLVNTKCGSPSSVLNTFGLEVASPEYLDDGVVMISFKFNVKHRT
jgi:hypothetical protein